MERMMCAAVGVRCAACAEKAGQADCKSATRVGALKIKVILGFEQGN
jgi:hypothetical protein